MAVKLRLKRMGAKKRPFYRIVAADSRVKRDGKDIELVGTYNPVTEPAEVKINEEVALKWLNNGAIPTDTVRDLLSKQGIMKKFTEYLVKNIVKDPEAVTVKSFEDEEFITIEVLANSDEMGALIGKDGMNASAIRTIVQAAAYVNNEKKVKINIDSI